MTPDTLRLRQICLVAPALEPAADELGTILGLPICHRDPRVGVFGVENVLFVAGTTFIEIIAPLRPDTAAARFLDRSNGQGGYIAIFDCADPHGRERAANAIGVATAYKIDRQRDYTAVQLHPRDCRATMLEFDRTEGGDDLTGRYSPAGPGWQQHADTRITRGITAIGAISPQPTDLAAHWAAILQRPVEADGLSIAIDGATIGFEAGGGSERLDWIGIDAADPAAIMAEARKRGRDSGPHSFVSSGMTFRL